MSCAISEYLLDGLVEVYVRRWPDARSGRKWFYTVLVRRRDRDRRHPHWPYFFQYGGPQPCSTWESALAAGRRYVRRHADGLREAAV